jgi:CheY-like chemotaxis protein
MKPSSAKTIFIVDDDPDDRQVILEAFLENNSQIDYVFIESGEELLANLQSDELNFPSLILLDLNMPGMLGLQTLREIRSNRIFSQIPIVILTTSTLPADRKVSYELGASCFLNKPSSYQQLVALANAIVQLWIVSEYQEQTKNSITKGGQQ